MAGLCLLLGGLGGAGLSSAFAAPPTPAEPTTEKPEKTEIRPEVEPVGTPPNDYSRYHKLDRFARALAIIEQYYVRPVDGEALIDAALDGLVQNLDPHTVYLLGTPTTPDQFSLRTREEAVTQAIAFARRQRVRAWFDKGDDSFLLLGTFRKDT